MKNLHKLLAMVMVLTMIFSFSVTAFAAPVDEATIDTSRTGSLDIYKYDLSSAEKDGIWDSSYLRTRSALVYKHDEAGESGDGAGKESPGRQATRITEV